MKTSPVDNTTEVMPRSGQNLFERACLCLSQPVWVLRIKPSPCFCLLPMTAKKQKTKKKSHFYKRQSLGQSVWQTKRRVERVGGAAAADVPKVSQNMDETGNAMHVHARSL